MLLHPRGTMPVTSYPNAVSCIEILAPMIIIIFDNQYFDLGTHQWCI